MSTPLRRTLAACLLAFLAALPLAGGDVSQQDSEADDARRKQLESLGYIGATEVSKPDRKKRGVTVNKDGATVGWTVWTSTGWGAGFKDVPGQIERRQAVLIDQDGNQHHTWTGVAAARAEQGWANVQIDAEGNLYAVDSRSALVKVDWDSNELWRNSGRFHHDLDLAANGDLWTIRASQRKVDFKGEERSIVEESVVVLDSATGKSKRVYPTWDALSRIDGFEASVDQWLAHKEEKESTASRTATGILHLNSIHVLRESADGLWDAGDFMTCFRNLHVVAVFDKDDGRVKWSWGRGILSFPHDPTPTSDGRIVVFDNGPSRNWSRVVEMDPRSGKIAWRYRGSKDDPFFSNIRGQAQRTENGNTLIVESQRGRAFEVGPEGEMLWEYFSPDVFLRRVDTRTGQRIHPPKLMRVPFRFTWLEGAALEAVKHRLARAAEPAGP